MRPVELRGQPMLRTISIPGTWRKVGTRRAGTTATTITQPTLWWWLFPRLRGFGENVRPFIARLHFCVCVCVCVWRLARAH